MELSSCSAFTVFCRPTGVCLTHWSGHPSPYGSTSSTSNRKPQCSSSASCGEHWHVIRASNTKRPVHCSVIPRQVKKAFDRNPTGARCCVFNILVAKPSSQKQTHAAEMHGPWPQHRLGRPLRFTHLAQAHWTTPFRMELPQ